MLTEEFAHFKQQRWPQS